LARALLKPVAPQFSGSRPEKVMKKANVLVGVVVAMVSFSAFAQARGNAGGVSRGKDRAIQVRQGNVDRLTAKKGADSKAVQKQTGNLDKFKAKQAPEAPEVPEVEAP
jgi:hypothetical protein